MPFSTAPRYMHIARLIAKHGGHELVPALGLEGWVGETAPETQTLRAEELVRDLEELGPTYVKFGQILASRPDLVREPYRSALRRLHSNVAPLPWEVVEQVLVTELGRPVAEVFATFDQEPLAAASIGQVHRATLPDGDEVAVKIQRPDIHQVMLGDLAVLDTIAKVVESRTAFGKGLQPVKIMRELRSALLRELSYEREASNLRRLAADLAAFDHIEVPVPYPDRSTQRVLTMSFVPGDPIDGDTDYGALGKTLADALFESYLHQVVVTGFFHADPHPGNLLVTPHGTAAILDLGMTATVPRALQRGLVKLLLALADRRAEDAADLFVRLAKDPPDAKPAVFKQQVVDFLLDAMGSDLEGLEVGRMMLELQRLAVDTKITVPSQFTLIGKTLLQLDQIGRSLDPSFRPDEAIRKHVAALFQGTIDDSLSVPRLLQTALETDDLMSDLPQQARSILGHLANNEVRIAVDHGKLDALEVTVRRAANRMAFALMGSAALLTLGVTASLTLPWLGAAVAVGLSVGVLGAGAAYAVIWWRGWDA